MFNKNNKNKKRRFLFWSSIFCFFLLLITKIISSRAMAVLASNNRVVVPNPLRIQRLGELFERIIHAIFIMAITILPLVFIWGAVVLMFSAGVPEKVQRGQRIMWYAALGFIIILFARGLVAMIRYAIGT